VLDIRAHPPHFPSFSCSHVHSSIWGNTPSGTLDSFDISRWDLSPSSPGVKQHTCPKTSHPSTRLFRMSKDCVCCYRWKKGERRIFRSNRLSKSQVRWKSFVRNRAEVEPETYAPIKYSGKNWKIWGGP
jgi:hypothetical protein